MAGILTPEWNKALTLTVALSMAVTPLLLLMLEYWQQHQQSQNEREADTIDEEDPCVVIAGFGRYGQIIGRLLTASGVRVIVLDHDPDHIDTLKRFGIKVYYGDATRLDMLEAAGAGKATVCLHRCRGRKTSVADRATGPDCLQPLQRRRPS